MTTRQPLALSLAGFQFTYRINYFDWRLLHGIDVDTVIRLTDVQAVEDCLDTLQRGSFPAERDRLSLANCVQLFRLLQLAVEYCAHLRAAHAALLEAYNIATAAAESWKSAARAYLDVGSAFLADSLATGGLHRGELDAADGARAALEGADRGYNAALDELEAEDARARHFRFRRQRTELSWSALHAADADRLVAALDVGALEGLLPNLTYGSITNEDDEQLTPHHFGQLIPLAQAALDYVLWQANATGALLEQAMAALQAACADVPMLTSATQDLHSNITSLLLTGQTQTLTQTPQPQQLQGGLLTGMTAGGGGGGPSGLALGGSVDLSYGASAAAAAAGSPPPSWPAADQSYEPYGSGRLGASPGLTRKSSPAQARPISGGPGGSPQVLRLGLSRLGSQNLGLGGGGGAGLGGSASYTNGLAAVQGAGGARGSLLSPPSAVSGNALDELAAAVAAATANSGGGGAAAALPVLELHSRTAELTHKVDAIEQDLRLERSKTEEMRRILADVRDRLNQRPGTATAAPGALGGAASGGTGTPQGGGGGGLSPAESLTFPAAAAATLEAGMGPSLLGGYSAFANPPSAAAAAAAAAGGGLRYGSTAGVSISGPQYSEPTSGPAKVRVFVDEDAIREQERQRAVQVLARQAERLKQQMLREHQERRLASSVSSSLATASLQLVQLGPGGGGGRDGAGGGGSKGGTRHSRQGSREGRPRGAARRSSPGGASNIAPQERDRSSHSQFQLQQQQLSLSDYGSDPEQFTAAAGYDPRVALRQGSAGGASASTAAGSGGSVGRPPRPTSRLSGPSIHSSLGDLSAAAIGGGGAYGTPGGGGGGGGPGLSRLATAAGNGGAAGGGGVRGVVGLGQRGGGAPTDNAEGATGTDAMALPPPSTYGSVSAESQAVTTSRRGSVTLGIAAASGAGGGGGVLPQSVRMAATTAFGSISLVVSEKEAAAAAAVAAAAAASSSNISKTSSFDRLSYRSVQGQSMVPQGGGTGATPSDSGGWDAAPAVAAGR